MLRSARITEGITKGMRGIEVAPWFAPLTPKREGYNCLVLDVFDSETLLKRARNDPGIPAEGIELIEGVDLVGSATEIAALVPSCDHGAFDYIVSSHNFEHLPNPIRFLQGAQTVLKEGGVLSMAVPDARACFDYFRPHTTLVDWLAAFREERTQPSASQVFQAKSYISMLKTGGKDIIAFSVYDDRANIHIVGDLGAEYQHWVNAKEADGYVDAHCSVMTPASFELLVRECRYLGLISFDIETISDPIGCEFHVRLVNRRNVPISGDFNALRTQLMHRIWDERAIVARRSTPESAIGSATPDLPLRQSLRKRMSVKYIHPLQHWFRRLRGASA